MRKRKKTECRRQACEIKTLSNVLLGFGSVRVIDGTTVEIVNEDGVLPFVPIHSEVKLNIYGEDSNFKILVGKVYLSTKELLRIVDVESFNDYEKRSFFRISVDMSGRCYFCEAADEEGTVEAAKLADSFIVKLHDLSVGGFLMTPDIEMSLSVGQLFSIQLPIHMLENVLFRIQRIYDGKFGCQFVDLVGKQEDILCRFIYQKQLDDIRARKLKNWA